MKIYSEEFFYIEIDVFVFIHEYNEIFRKVIKVVKNDEWNSKTHHPFKLSSKCIIFISLQDVLQVNSMQKKCLYYELLLAPDW